MRTVSIEHLSESFRGLHWRRSCLSSRIPLIGFGSCTLTDFFLVEANDVAQAATMLASGRHFSLVSPGAGPPFHETISS